MPLVDGAWQDSWFDTKSTGGNFERAASTFRDWVKADGSTRFLPLPDRYHLYISHACPWAHRTVITRLLKRLEHVISISVVHPYMGSQGWTFDNYDGTSGCSPDLVNGTQYLHEVYTRADPKFTGRVTVPVLWDKQEQTIVNNESAEIMRMLNGEFNELADASVDLYPVEKRAQIDEINSLVYENINNGVYRCGFATSQSAYEDAFDKLFSSLDHIEHVLANNRYLVGENITEADWRLFTTLVRFDAVYVGHFKCNLKRIADYPNLSRLLAELYSVPGIKDTIYMGHIKRHYYESHPTINPSGIVPIGPKLPFA